MYITKVTLKNARRYAYSNTRIRAKLARMLDNELIQQIVGARDMSAALAILMQTDYKDDIEYYGGIGIKAELLDFAFNRHLARMVGELTKIAPKSDAAILSSVMKGWGVSNINLALEAKAQSMHYDQISKYLVDYGEINSKAIEEAMSEVSAEEMVHKLMEKKSFRELLKPMAKALRDGKPLPIAEFELERAYFDFIKACSDGVGRRDKNAQKIMEMDIARINIMMALRAKKRGMPAEKFEQLLISEKTPQEKKLKRVYPESDSVEALAAAVNEFGIADMIETYKKKRQLVLFDIHMRNAIFIEWMRLLEHSMLSLGTIIAYAHAKEIETFRLRDAIKSKEYQISSSLNAEILNA